MGPTADAWPSSVAGKARQRMCFACLIGDHESAFGLMVERSAFAELTIRCVVGVAG